MTVGSDTTVTRSALDDPATRAPSLHLRTLGWLVFPLAMMSAVMLVEVYHSADNSTQRVQDQMLLSMAFGISENALNTQGDLLLLEVIQETSNDTVFYKVRGPGNAFVVGYSGLPGLPADVAPESHEPYFYLGRYRGQRVRAVALRTLVEDREIEGWMTVIVAQPTDTRDALVWDQVIGSSVRLGLLIVIAGTLAWFAVTLGLKPLARLERAIGRRSVDDLSPIDVVVPREITSVELALNDLLRRLERSISRNKRFVSNASHQLRTPVASLVARTELLLRDDGAPAARRSVERIHASAVRMSRLIAQLLSLARADGFDRAQQSFAPVEAIELAREMANEHVPRALERDVDLGFEQGAASAVVLGNAALLEEMLRNLLDNACRYCPPGSEVTLRAGVSSGRVEIEVADDGPGIAPADRGRVLERFARLNDEDGAGSGLGLAIALEVAQLHGGSLVLGEPVEGHGLVVRISIPAAGAGG